MNREISLDHLGITFYIEVEYEEDDGKIGTSGVCSVEVEGFDGKRNIVKCDMERFYKDLEGEIYQALEDDIQADYEAYCDALYEQAREEGKL